MKTKARQWEKIFADHVCDKVFVSIIRFKNFSKHKNLKIINCNGQETQTLQKEIY